MAVQFYTGSTLFPSASAVLARNLEESLLFCSSGHLVERERERACSERAEIHFRCHRHPFSLRIHQNDRAQATPPNLSPPRYISCCCHTPQDAARCSMIRASTSSSLNTIISHDRYFINFFISRIRYTLRS